MSDDNSNNNNRVSFQHMQFLVEAALTNLFNSEKDHHGWTFDEYSKASVEFAMMSAEEMKQTGLVERYLN